VKIVIDTNVAISGLLWHGPPNHILKWARDGIVRILACEGTNAELKRVIEYERFAERLSALGMTPEEVFAYFVNLALFVPSPKRIPKKIIQDPFDNFFLALAMENKAHLIVSGDNHLLELKEYNHIQIVTPAEACKVIEIQNVKRGQANND
jgi:putative PIN family toxin of toxin-antitoxin system